MCIFVLELLFMYCYFFGVKGPHGRLIVARCSLPNECSIERKKVLYHLLLFVLFSFIKRFSNVVARVLDVTPMVVCKKVYTTEHR